MPRGGEGAQHIRWFSVEPGNMLHAANAYEDGQGRIVLEGPTVDREGFRLSWNWWVGAPGRGTEPNTRSYMRRWVIDAVAGTVDEQIIDDLAVEFPTLNEDRTSASSTATSTRCPFRTRKASAATASSSTTAPPAPAASTRSAMPGCPVKRCSFPPPVPPTRTTAISSPSSPTSSRTPHSCWSWTPSGLDRIATVHLPRRVTAGIHGSWIPDTALEAAEG